MDLKDLYRDVIVDHNRLPRNFGPMPDADRHAEGFNPLCGDRLTLFVKLDGDTIPDVAFQGSGCAISVASASLLTETVKGRTVPEAERLFAIRTSVTMELTPAQVAHRPAQTTQAAL